MNYLVKKFVSLHLGEVKCIERERTEYRYMGLIHGPVLPKSYYRDSNGCICEYVKNRYVDS